MQPRVLGTIASNEEEPSAKWAACDLATVLVRPEVLAHDASARRISLPADEADVSVPPSLAFGLRAREQRMLFEHLPLLSTDMRPRREMTMVGTWQRWGDVGLGPVPVWVMGRRGTRRGWQRFMRRSSRRAWRRRMRWRGWSI